MKSPPYFVLKKYLHFRALCPLHSYPNNPSFREMDLRLNDRITLQPGQFYAIIAPLETFLAGLNDSPVIGRYTTLFISGNFSRLLDGFSRTSGNFEIRRAFTVHQLLTILREDDHSIVFVEHDPTLYEDAGESKRVVPSTMKDVSRNAIFVLYSPTMDKHFAYLASAAGHVIIYDDTNDSTNPYIGKYSNTKPQKRGLSNPQKTLF